MTKSLIATILRAIGHTESSPQTKRAVALINEDMRREGRKPASVEPKALTWYRYIGNAAIHHMSNAVEASAEGDHEAAEMYMKLARLEMEYWPWPL